MRTRHIVLIGCARPSVSVRACSCVRACVRARGLELCGLRLPPLGSHRRADRLTVSLLPRVTVPARQQAEWDNVVKMVAELERMTGEDKPPPAFTDEVESEDFDDPEPLMEGEYLGPYDVPATLEFNSDVFEFEVR